MYLVKYPFYCILTLFLLSCTTTSKYHTIKEVIVSVNNSKLYTNNNQESKVSATNELKRGIFQSGPLKDGEINQDNDEAIVFQTIGKIDWKIPVWWTDSREYRDAQDASVRQLDIPINYSNEGDISVTIEQINNNAKVVNTFSELQDRINYEQGLIPIWSTSYFGIYPKKLIEHMDRMFNKFEYIPGRNFTGRSRDNGVKCQSNLDKSENNGCVTVIAAKKYNSIEINANVLYEFAKIIYERDYCSNIFIPYFLLFDSVEISNMVEINKNKKDWHSIASNTQDLYKYTTFKDLVLIPNYYTNESTHEAFVENIEYLNNTYRGPFEKFNRDLDSIIIERIKHLPQSIDSINKLVNTNLRNIDYCYEKMYDFLKNSNNVEGSKLLEELEVHNNSLQNHLKHYPRLEKFEELINNKIKYYEEFCQKNRSEVNYKTQELKSIMTKLDKSVTNALITFKNNQSKSSSKLKIEKLIDSKKADKVNGFIDNILSLPVGSVMRFTPYMLDYIDERNDRKTALTSPIVIVKKVNNVDRKTVLVQVLQMPIPDGFNSNNMRVEYSLKIGAEVLLPISEFEGYPGNSSSNQMLDLIDSLK
jgi:hypothetical protein